MDTKVWGKFLWGYMFCMVANYPLKIDPLVPENQKLAKSYRNFFFLLKDVLPCKYCRQSWKIFMKKNPIDKALTSRKHLMFWLYTQKNYVTAKLIKQENERYLSELNKLPIEERTKKNIRRLKKEIFRTNRRIPTFEKICAKYEKYRAGCSAKTKTCSRPKQI